MGERELERKPTFPTPSIQAANRGIFKPCCRHKARRHSRSLTSALERGVQGIPSHGREARGWALTQSPLAGALVSCRTHPPGFQPRQGNFLEPCNHHHLAASFQRRMAGAWVLPGSRHPPPCSPYSVVAAPGDPGCGGGHGLHLGSGAARVPELASVRRPCRPWLSAPQQLSPPLGLGSEPWPERAP